MSSSRSDSHASTDGHEHDEPLLPLGTGHDNSWMPMPLRRRGRFHILAKPNLKRVLILAVSLLFVVGFIVYRRKPVSYSGAITPHLDQDHHRIGQDYLSSQGQGQDRDHGDQSGQSSSSSSSTAAQGHKPQEAAGVGGAAASKPDPTTKEEDRTEPRPDRVGDAPYAASETREAIVVVLPSSGIDIDDDRGDEDQDGDYDSDSGGGERESDDQDLQAKKEEYQAEITGKPWLRFTHLNGYFHGLKTLVPPSQHSPEYPNPHVSVPAREPPVQSPVPRPDPYDPYDADASVVPCFLDANESTPAPDIYAYNALPAYYPDPVLGSYEVLGMRDDVCFDRFGRYGPYGLGYSKDKGGVGVGEDTESAGSSFVWDRTGQIDYSNMDWADAQERCFDSNRHRLRTVDADTGEMEKAAGKKARIAVVVRCYTDFAWTEHVILNFRAMINELALRSGGEYAVHMLVQVRDADVPFWSDPETVQRILDSNVPPEFHGLVSLWSEPQMRLYYPGKFDSAYSNPSGRDLHGVYRGGHLPLQIFAMEHPEYEHFWNWEMDMRHVGSYYELFDRLGKFGEAQPRALLWERNARYYIPSYHGTWDNFTQQTQRDTVRSGLPTPFGPLMFSGRKSLRFESKGESVLPDDCDVHRDDRARCGVGEAADLITLNPIFDTDQSGWFFGLDATGYGPTPPPRRASIITASRLSRRLLMAMHEEVWRHHHTMFPEMFPTSVALHHGFKGVFGPHPVYLDRAWLPFGKAVDDAFNGGEYHSTSGHGSPFDLSNEHNHQGTSWYYNSAFSGMIWRRWLGYAQKDGRGKHSNSPDSGKLRGGVEEESSESSTGRLCLRSMLVHPIKKEHPDE
ncbi:Protein of unknown function (DUF3405) [Geosmithia morbida]|uniref:Uncharacterized protein n=1 Tax=Geosmithia morbida TaxID=1094350 RepID=A0A9P4YR59_9HYPO|nr:Protein of unknown function (DUF3405) [Geosmithia morbida]KAF4121062.1 Protein of unknown function (DUF3405) [Geosmithia morbida]